MDIAFNVIRTEFRTKISKLLTRFPGVHLYALCRGVSDNCDKMSIRKRRRLSSERYSEPYDESESDDE